MFPNEDLQRWAGRSCLLVGMGLGMVGYHFANIRFAPLVAGFAILAGVCYGRRIHRDPIRSLRPSGQHPAI